MTSVGSIVAGAFGVVLRHPLSVLVWGLVYVAMFSAVALLMWPMFEAILSMPLKSGNGEELAAELSRAQVNSGVTSLVQIASYVVPAICSAAAIRTVLRPEQGGFFHLRIGMDEVRVGACWLIVGVATGVGAGLALIPGAIIGAIAYAAGGPEAMALVVCLLVLVLICAYFYFMVRMSLMAPLSFLRREFAFGEAWGLTKGRFWTLFGGYFVVGLVATAVALAGFIAFAWPLLAELSQVNFEPARIQEAFAAFAARAGRFDAMILLGWVAMGLSSGIGIALYSGAAATATRDLVWDAQGTGDTFA
jgi:hypothetical protein